MKRPMAHPNDDTPRTGFNGPNTAATILGGLAGALTYTLCILASLPTPRYFPVTGHWDLGPHPGSVSMGYYGNLLVSGAALALAYAIGRIPAVQRTLSRPAPAQVLTWLTTLVFVGCLTTQLVHELVRWGAR